MRTRSQARISVPEPSVRQPSVESSNLEKPDNPPIVTMADNRTMAQLLEAPTEGYEDAIVIPEITANNFEIKHVLRKMQTKSKLAIQMGQMTENAFKNLFTANTASTSVLGTLPGPKAVNLDTEVKTGHDDSGYINGSTKGRPPPVVQIFQSRNPNSLSQCITFTYTRSTSRYTANFIHMTANGVDVIDMGSENTASGLRFFCFGLAHGNLLRALILIVDYSSPTLNSIWKKVTF
ncbi:hypothetical protein Tco_0006481 [Tanacetum coccineum]